MRLGPTLRKLCPGLARVPSTRLMVLGVDREEPCWVPNRPCEPLPREGDRPGSQALAGVDGSAELSAQSQPVGKPWPWSAWEPRWCRLLPTAWLSRFPSGLDSSPPPLRPSKVPRESGKPLAKLILSPPGFPKPLPEHLGARFPQGHRRKPSNLPRAPLFLGLFRAGQPQLHSTAH